MRKLGADLEQQAPEPAGALIELETVDRLENIAQQLEPIPTNPAAIRVWLAEATAEIRRLWNLDDRRPPAPQLLPDEFRIPDLCRSPYLVAVEQERAWERALELLIEASQRSAEITDEDQIENHAELHELSQRYDRGDRALDLLHGIIRFGCDWETVTGRFRERATELAHGSLELRDRIAQLGSRYDEGDRSLELYDAMIAFAEIGA
ncbi:MAG: hypothetical protein GY715_05825 [Planctomycetes bacterium]|nr:hypothetical protein [Planctomycetota bacterium]